MKSKEKVEGKLGHVVQIQVCRLIETCCLTSLFILKQDPFTRWKKKRIRLHGTDLCQPCSVCFRFIFFASGANHVTEPFYLLFLFALWKGKKKTKVEMPRGKRPQYHYITYLLTGFKSDLTRTLKVRKNRQQTTCNLFCNIAARLQAVSFSSDLEREVHARASVERRSRERRETRAAAVSRLQSCAWWFTCLGRFARRTKKKRDSS